MLFALWLLHSLLFDHLVSHLFPVYIFHLISTKTQIFFSSHAFIQSVHVEKSCLSRRDRLLKQPDDSQQCVVDRQVYKRKRVKNKRHWERLSNEMTEDPTTANKKKAAFKRKTKSPF